MTKLVRKLKQMAKKRSHRKAVQKRKQERAVRDLERVEVEANQLEDAVDLEVARLNGEEPVKKEVHIVGDLVVEAPARKSKKQLSRKQSKRKVKLMERGLAITETLEKKWDLKKRRVKVRAQVRNENLHN